MNAYVLRLKTSSSTQKRFQIRYFFFREMLTQHLCPMGNQSRSCVQRELSGENHHKHSCSMANKDAIKYPFRDVEAERFFFNIYRIVLIGLICSLEKISLPRFQLKEFAVGLFAKAA